MKNLIATLLIVSTVLMFSKVNGQACNSSGPSACTPANLSAQGFENPDSIPCAIQGQLTDLTISFNTFNYLPILGGQNVDSIQFAGIGNLPCGLCWATNHSNDLFHANDLGCIRLYGYTNDTVGQYLIALSLTAWVNGTSTSPSTKFNIPPSEVNSVGGVYLYDRVESASAMVCTPVDTSTSNNTHNLNAHTGCVTGIEEIASQFTSLSIIPNPVNTTATLSFNALKQVTYQMRITDITGKVISSKQLYAVPGVNTSIIERNGIPAGIYFVTLTEGKSSVTRKFAVID